MDLTDIFRTFHPNAEEYTFKCTWNMEKAMAPHSSTRLGNPMDGGAWWATAQGVTKSWTWLSDFTFTFHFPALEKEMATHSSVLAWRIPGTGAWWVPSSRKWLMWLSSSSTWNILQDRPHFGASLMAQRLKRLPPMRETWVRSLGQEDPLEKEMATHSSILAWRIWWTEEPGGLQSTGSQRVGHDWVTLLTYLLISYRRQSFFIDWNDIWSR